MENILTFPASSEAEQASPSRIGEYLLQGGYITPLQLQQALAVQRKSGGTLGTILTHLGHVSPLHLYKTLAKQHHIPFVNLLTQPVNNALLDKHYINAYISYGFVPHRLEGDYLVVATTQADTQHLHRYIAHDPHKIRYVMTSPVDIAHAIEQTFSAHLTESACHHLRRAHPDYALTRQRHTPFRLSIRQLVLLHAIIYALCISYAPEMTIAVTVILSSAFFIACSIFKAILFGIGVAKRDAVFAHTEPPASDKNLPIYTVLVPMYREAGAVKGLLHSLGTLDYPAEKLDIKLILEQDDTDTLHAIKAARPDRRFSIIIVPKSAPQTKPKACNYAAHFARGEFITIYDAEDAPHIMQLRRAVATFRAGGVQRACLQGRLNYYNHDECMLTRLFSLEYSMLFDYILPALYHLNIPIPLGGTSNHIRRDVLEQLGSWDAYNVTEDADLGIRMATEHYVTLPIDSLTQEEAPVTMIAWIKQRSRWIKGYLQTWSVMSRDHRTMRARHGAIGFWGIHFFIGASSLSFILAPLLWCGSIAWLLGAADTMLLPDWMITMAVCVFGIGAAVQCISAWLVNRTRDTPYRWWVIGCFPLYFLFHSIAAARSLWQLLVKPYYWDKTTHGLTGISRQDLTNRDARSKTNSLV